MSENFFCPPGSEVLDPPVIRSLISINNCMGPLTSFLVIRPLPTPTRIRIITHFYTYASTLGPLLLLIRHSRITSFLLFVRLFYLLPFPCLSLTLSLTIFLELKSLCMHWNASVWPTTWEALYIYIYLHTIQYSAVQYSRPAVHCARLKYNWAA